jgi:tetratricopeptide (TPR) repeat protein
MTKSIIFKFTSKNTYNNNITKPFFENLKLLDPFYDNFSAKLNSYEHSNFIVYGLEKTQSFVDVYKIGYNSNSYKGYVNQLNLFENIAKQKLNKNDSSVKGLVEKAELYKSGLNGVEKNNEKALELYQQAFDKSKDKEILLKIGQLYQENKNFEKAIIFFENYINNNENINPIVYSNLGWIYKDDSSQFYDLNKAKYNFENKIKVLEENYNIENDEIKKAKLKKEISFTYSVLAFMYDYYGKNVTPNISVPYYEKTMLWNEDDDSTAFKLMRLYAKEWNTDNFKRDTKKAKYWALKVCEIAKRLEERNRGSHESKIANMNCSTANDHISNNFKYLKK